MYFGVDYYPEHWVYPYAGTPEQPEARWARDLELMRAAGVNVVRMGEFAWGLYEPAEGKFDFSWMRRAMDLCGQSGIQVVLGTPMPRRRSGWRRSTRRFCRWTRRGAPCTKERDGRIA